MERGGDSDSCACMPLVNADPCMPRADETRLADGCMDATVLHEMSHSEEGAIEGAAVVEAAPMVHNMNVCVPDTFNDTAAQAYFDASSAYYTCLLYTSPSPRDS